VVDTERARAASPLLAGAIDADVHTPAPPIAELLPFVPPYWRERYTDTGIQGPPDAAYPPWLPLVETLEQSPTALAAHIDRLGAAAAVVSCPYAVDSVQNPYSASTLAAAVNDWLAAEWLDADERLRGSIVVPVQQPDLAVAEIERFAGDSRFVQVAVPVRTSLPLGNRLFHPLWEAADRAGLAVAVHFGGAPGNPPTGSGWPLHYVEETIVMSQVAATQLMSLVAEGVFDRFPELRVVFVECGWAWVPAWLNRFDKEWRALRREVPWVRRLPSEYVVEHCRWTLRPFDPPSPSELLDVLDEFGSEDVLLYASDYPHLHVPSDDDCLAGLPEQLVSKIARENAKAFYRL
jgi:predicted TIM-barrel fold metal-dependent hydrolase